MLNSWNKHTRKRNMSWGTLHYVKRIMNEHLIKSHPKGTLASFAHYTLDNWIPTHEMVSKWVKKSFLILVNSSCVPAGASTISRKIANGSEKLEPVSIEVLSSSCFFPVQISKWKIQTNRKWDVIPFCLEITWEWASSICDSTGTKGKMSERAEKQITSLMACGTAIMADVHFAFLIIYSLFYTILRKQNDD